MERVQVEDLVLDGEGLDLVITAIRITAGQNYVEVLLNCISRANPVSGIRNAWNYKNFALLMR